MKPGRLIHNRYKLKREVGSGSFGEVYLATDTLKAGDVALKILHRDQAADVGIKLFQEEFKTLTKFSHPNLVPVYDFGFEGPRAFFTSEYIEGPNIFEATEGLGWKGILDYTVQVLRALEYIHSRGIIHRDIKPTNMLVSRKEGVVKLLDFGLARHLKGEPEGFISGTPAYMAPEVRRGISDARSDIYSLGVVLQQVITRRQPGGPLTPSTSLRAGPTLSPEGERGSAPHPFDFAQGRPGPLPGGERGFEMPDFLHQITQRLLKENPNERFSRANYVIRTINRFIPKPYELETPATQEGYLFSPRIQEREEELRRMMEVYHNLTPHPHPLPGGERGFAPHPGGERGSTPHPHPLPGGERGIFIFVTGEFGVGKKTLLKEFAHAVQLEGGICISANSFQEITDILAAREGRKNPYEDIPKNKEKWLEQLFNFFRERKNKAPLALILPEFQNADTIDGQILTYLVQNLAQSEERLGILPVVSYHPFRLSEGLKNIISNLQEETSHLTVHLKNLDTKGLGHYVSGILGLEMAPENFIKQTYALTGGNPAFVQELMREVLALIAPEAGLENALSRIPWDRLSVVKSSGGLVERGFKTLDPLSRKVLSILSIMPNPVSYSLLVEMSGEEEGAILEKCILLDKREFITQKISRGDIILNLTGNLQKEAIYRQLPANKRSGLHLKAATMLEKRYTAPRPPHVLEIAYHYSRSHDREKIGLYGPRAGRILKEKYSNDKAIHYFRDSLPCLKKRTERVDILKEIAELETITGRFNEAIATFKTLLKCLPKKGESDILTKIGLAYQKKGDLKAAEKCYKKALSPSTKPAERSHIISLMARIALQNGQWGRARELCDSELSKVRSKNSFSTAPLWDTLGLVAFREGLTDEASVCYQNNLEIYRAAHSPRGMAHALNNLGIVAYQAGDLSRALNYYEQGHRLAGEIGDTHLETTATSNLGTVYQEMGDYKRALAAYKESLLISSRLGNEMEQLGAMANLANLYILFGAVREAEDQVGKFRRKAVRKGFKFFIGYGDLIQGDISALKEKWEEAGDAYRKALKVFADINSNREAALARLNLIDVEIKTGKFQEGRRGLKDNFPDQSILNLSEIKLKRDILAAKLELADPEGDQKLAELHLKNILGYLEQKPSAELLWEAYVLKGDHRRADEIVKTNLKNIPEEYREDYLRAKDRKGVIRPMETKKETAGEGLKGGLELKRLLEINRLMNSEKNVKRLLEFIVDSGLELTGARRAFLILKDKIPEKGLNWSDIDIARNFDEDVIGDEELEISSSILKDVLEKGQTIVTDNAARDRRFKQYQSILDLKLNSILAVPLKKNSKILGVLYLDNKMKSKLFTQAEVDMIESFADLSVVALENAKYFESVEASRKESLNQARLLKKELQSQRIEALSAKSELARTKEALGFRFSYKNIVGQSPKMQEIFRTLDRITDTAIPVLIYGESGTGKELIAKALHYNSSRQHHHFVSENCTAIPENLLESELFGHVKGAFTGADKDKEGLFQYASGGTLFLDEIGDMPYALQSKLLRALQEGEVRPVGGREPISVDVRVVSASHRDLKNLIKENKFRKDLFWRVNGITISLPPLRERKEDIPLLVDHFLDRCAEELGKKRPPLNKEVLDLLMRYPWPGNVREMAHTIRNAFLFASGEIVGETLLAIKPELSEGFFPREVAATTKPSQDLGPIPDEKSRLIEALKICGYNKSDAAKKLGLSRKTIYNKLKKYGIKTRTDLS